MQIDTQKEEPVYRTIRYGDIDVYFVNGTQGGGQTFGQDYLRIVPLLPKRPGTVFEWCSGPAFIAFSLLAHGLCDRLCLADINPLSVASCRKTVEMNNLQDRVTVYEANGITGIPDHEKWDLVVANPPHSGTADAIPEWGDNPLIYMDPNWALHRRFYREVGKYLNPGGLTVIQENAELSRADEFTAMIQEGGLQPVYTSDAVYSLQFGRVHTFMYYLVAAHDAADWNADIDLNMPAQDMAC